jgi:murein DD-endopeptidase MepM/ murein hydrolase activator NlpD
VPVVLLISVFSYTSPVFVESAVAESVTSSAHNSQTMPLLRAALNIDPNPSKGGGDVLVVGEAALLSEAGPSGTLADIEERPPRSDQINVYVVREGDTLSQIANMFNVSMNTIRWANDLSSATDIHPGQTLVILPISGVRHTVKGGDTLKSIAEKYGGDIEEILNYNGFTENAVIAEGDVVVVPHGEIAAPTGVSAQKTAQSSGGNGTPIASSPSYSGYFVRPVDGVRTQGLHGYNAVDLGAPYGAPIVAAAAGEVIISRSSGWNGGYGAYIVVRHDNGTQTLYAHNSGNIVYAGDTVVQGQAIGYVGTSGRSTGSHLHFEVRGAQNPF